MTNDDVLIAELIQRGHTPTFPTLLDATALSDFKSCKRKFFWSTLLKQVRKEANPHFVAGGAYAKGHEVFKTLYYSGRAGKEEALERAVIALIKEYGDYEPNPDGKQSEKYKTWDRMAAALVTYYEEFPPERDFLVPALSQDREPLIEFSFATPFFDLKNPQTNEPILYGGRFDGIVHLVPDGWRGKYTDNVLSRPLYGYDDKTTYGLGPSWADQWKLRSQFIGYKWGASTFGFDLQGFIIRGCGIQKNDIKHLSTLSNYGSWLVAEWLETTYRTIQDVIQAWNDRVWTKDFDGACTSYGVCPYASLCLSPTPWKWLAGEYKVRTWSPVEEK